MKCDVLIIGGGLAGLICGNRLQQEGMKCVIISTGQSALHFFSGSFDLLNALADGTEVSSPISAIRKISHCHPYAKIGDRFAHYTSEAKKLLQNCGIETVGDAECNHYRITPMGTLRSTWLTLSDAVSLQSGNEIRNKKILITNIDGFFDFNSYLIADELEKYAAECQIYPVNLPELERLRISPTEMRSTNIAKVLENKKTFEQLISKIMEKCADVDIVVLPALFGLTSMAQAKEVKERLKCPVWLIPTMPPSVPGIHVQQQLRRSFEKSGGTYLIGDTVIKADFCGDKVKAVYSLNHGEFAFVADYFVLASGSYFSSGLVAQCDRIIEPIFKSDVEFAGSRDDWYNKAFFNKQNYMTFGVATDDKFRIKIGGHMQQNLYAIGSILSGFNAIHEGCGAGVSMLTALYVADQLINKD